MAWRGHDTRSNRISCTIVTTVVHGARAVWGRIGFVRMLLYLVSVTLTVYVLLMLGL